MADKPSPVLGAGEYGATTVELTKDGSMYRLAFGRNDGPGKKVFHGAALLSSEAMAELKEQIGRLDD